MFYHKNLPVWERSLRVCAGLLMMACGLLAPAVAGSTIGYVIVACGAGAAITGLVGYCPACAMVGRKV